MHHINVSRHRWLCGGDGWPPPPCAQRPRALRQHHPRRCCRVAAAASSGEQQQQQQQQGDAQAAAAPPLAATVAVAAAAPAPEPAAETATTAVATIMTANPSVCPLCAGTGRCACKECSGTGRLARGGYHRKNPVDLSRILSSKWTALETTMGWRHFRATAVRKGGKTATFVLLQASCDPKVQLWVNAVNLKDRARWAAGWLQMSEIVARGAGDGDGSGGSGGGGGTAGATPPSAVGAGQVCQSCGGLGAKVCASCDGSGQARVVML